MTDHVFLRIRQLKMFGFQFAFLNCLHHRITSNNCNNVVSRVILYSSSFVGALLNEIPLASLGLCLLKIKQFLPGIFKFSTKHEDNPFTLSCFMVFRPFLFIFYAGLRSLGSNNFRNSSCKEKTAALVRVSTISFRFL